MVPLSPKIICPFTKIQSPFIGTQLQFLDDVHSSPPLRGSQHSIQLSSAHDSVGASDYIYIYIYIIVRRFGTRVFYSVVAT